MPSTGYPTFIFGGVGKSASTWIYECLCAHPEIGMHTESDRGTADSLHFFDINYHRGESWYRDQFSHTDESVVLGETTTSYLNSEYAPKRISKTVPDVTLIFNLRNPINRAYSHWWHGKSAGLWDYDFEEALHFYPPYQMWIEPGFYHHNLKCFDQYFSDEQIEIFFFDDLVEDSRDFIKNIYSCIGVDDTYVPEQVNNKSNSALYDAPDIIRELKSWVSSNAPNYIKTALKPVYQRTRGIVETRSEYEEGMDKKIRRDLEDIYVQDIKKLSDRTGRDLSRWLKYNSIDNI